MEAGAPGVGGGEVLVTLLDAPLLTIHAGQTKIVGALPHAVALGKRPSFASDMVSLAPKTESEKYCTECGAVIRKAAEICPKCGVRQAPVLIAYSSGRNRVAAALFAILLGGLGIHKFYLGRIGQGVIYVLFFWTFLPALVALIEGIVYLTMTDAEFAAKYG